MGYLVRPCLKTSERKSPDIRLPLLSKLGQWGPFILAVSFAWLSQTASTFCPALGLALCEPNSQKWFWDFGRCK